MARKPPKPPVLHAAIDVLSEVLESTLIECVFASVTTLRGACGVAIPGNLDAALHIILQGCVFIGVERQPPVKLQEGAFFLLPVDRPHFVADAPGRRLLAANELPLNSPNLGLVLQLGHGSATAKVLTVAFRMKSPWSSSPFRVLPKSVFRRREETPRVWSQAGRLTQEILDQQPGRHFLIRRSAETLLIEALRYELSSSHSSGLLKGIGDRSLRLALEAIHRDCAQDWSVSKLARIAATSRSTLAERFRKKLGVTPRQYLIDWRMKRASQLLGSTDLSVFEVAHQVGYQSEPAFARTFKRVMRVSPGKFRRTLVRSQSTPLPSPHPPRPSRLPISTKPSKVRTHASQRNRSKGVKALREF